MGVSANYNMLTSMEFINIGKRIFLNLDSDFDLANVNIKRITRRILDKYPQIGQAEIDSDYQELKPLQDWAFYVDLAIVRKR